MRYLSRRWKRYRVNRALTRVAKDLLAAIRRHDHDAVSKLDVLIHELSWKKEKLK